MLLNRLHEMLMDQLDIALFISRNSLLPLGLFHVLAHGLSPSGNISIVRLQ